MFYKPALDYSNAHYDEVIEYIKETRPYIREIFSTSIKDNVKRDYFGRIDATGVSASKTYTIQVKARMEGNNDFVLTARKLVDPDIVATCPGFWYKGDKYSFTVLADIYAEYLGDGSIYTITREEIEAMESYLSDELGEYIKYVGQQQRKDKNGEYTIKMDEYDVYISTSNLANIQFHLALNSNVRLKKYFEEHPI